MKTFLKKFFVACTVFLAAFSIINILPASSASATEYRLDDWAETGDEPAGPADDSQTFSPNCDNFFLGFKSWDCGILRWQGDANLKANVVIIGLNIAADITILAAYLVVGFVIYGGYQYILGSGDPAKTAAGKKTILHAFIGLAIVLLSSVIFNAIRFAFLGDKSLGNCATGSCIEGVDIIGNAINWVIGIAGVVALIFIFIGGIGYLTSSGDPSKLQKAKSTIIYAAIGLAIVALSLTLTAFVTNLIKNSKQTSLLEDTNNYSLVSTINERRA